jgi:Na+/melibiose symporter-like transporter
MWYSLILAVSSAMWLSALVVMFVMREDIKAYEESQHEKRRTGLVGEISTGTIAMLDNLAIACGCFGVCAFLFCLYQWFVVYYLHSTRFTKTEMREGYRKIRKIDPPKDETGIEI